MGSHDTAKVNPALHGAAHAGAWAGLGSTQRADGDKALCVPIHVFLFKK